MEKSKDPIRLRKRQLRNGNTSLYLDIYLNGKRSYEFLNLYLVPEKSRADKDKNKETLRLADAIRATRIVDLQNGRFGFDGRYKQDTNFLDYYRKQCDKRAENTESLGNWSKWSCVQKHLEYFCRPDMTFRDVTPEFVQSFKDYLDKTARVGATGDKKTARFAKPLTNGTKVAYFNILRAVINEAYREGIIPDNPLRTIAGFKQEETERPYLTVDELRAMVNTDCKYPNLRRAFLFSCLTGLRKSDIKKLKWSEVRQQGEFTRIVFKQKKTGGQEYIDLNPQAAELLGERGEPDENVFPDFAHNSYYLMQLQLWANQAGIKKQVTFHCGRHTFAVMMLDLGVDIYTVQKLLGHKKINTTQVYAKVMDKKKQEAAMLIPSILPIGSDHQ